MSKKGKTMGTAIIRKSTVLALAIATVMFFSFTLFGEKTYANTAQDAENISLNAAKTHTYVGYETEYYYKFVAPETTYYAVNVTNFIRDNTYISVVDSKGYEVAFAGWDQYQDKVSLACRLIKGNTYYICVECFTEEENVVDEDDTPLPVWTLTTTISKHNHSFRTVSKYTGATNDECSYPRCNFYRTHITAKPTIKKLKKGKKSFKVTWKCKCDANEGFEIQYSTSKKFKKTKTVKAKWSVTTKKVSKLKKRKTYYVRIRAYVKTTQTDGAITTDYGPWSKAKKVKTK